MEFTYYKSGHWRVSCTHCGQYIVCESIAEAYRRGHSHEKVCGM